MSATPAAPATDAGPRDSSPLTAHRDSAGPRRPWMVWRSPADQPGWARPVLLLIAAVAALLYSWNITSSGYALYYSDAVKSMSVSWKALLFGAMDPGATITPDKIPGSFVPQALSARVFGFHEWSVTLPQVVEGVVCVLVMYRVVRRWAGPKAGIIAAGLFTFTPVVASMFGHSMEDGGLTFCLVLAADCYQRAVLDARLRSLVFSGVWVGLGFQAKMMQAWMVLPALAVGYLVAAPAQLRRRVGQLLVAGVVCAAVSLSWVALVTLVPAKDRPYVDGSTNNSAVAMVFGYNGLERFGIHVTGSVPTLGAGRSATRGPAGSQGAGPGAAAARGPAGQYAQGGGGQYALGAGGQYAPGAGGPSAGAPAANGRNPAPAAGRRDGITGADSGSSWLKLFQSRFGPQIGWTYPLAVLALVLGLWWHRRVPRTDRLRGGFVMWGTWLVVVGLVFSKMSSIPHTAYMATLAPALAALAAGGIVMMWQAYREGGPRAWALPAAVAAEAAWSWYLGSFDAGFLPWLKWLMLAASVIGVAAMVLGRVGAPIRSRLLVGGLLAGLAGAVLTPVAWSASVLDTRYGGSAFDASAGPGAMGAGPGARVTNVGPAGQSGPPGFGGGSPAGTGTGGAASSGRPRAVAFAGPGGNISTKLTSDQSKLYAYVRARRGGATYVMATDGWTAASPYILATGDTVLPMGGFSGSVPHPTLGDFVSLIHTGQLRYVIVSPSGGGFGRGGSTGSVAQIRTWVQKSCAQVPASDYGVSAAPAGAAPAGIFDTGGSGTLYRCSTSS